MGLREAVRLLGAQQSPSLVPLLSLHMQLLALPVKIHVWMLVSSEGGRGAQPGRVACCGTCDVKHEALFVLWEPPGTKGSAGGKTSRSHIEIVQWSGSWTAVWINTSLFDVVGTTKLPKHHVWRNEESFLGTALSRGTSYTVRSVGHLVSELPLLPLEIMFQVLETLCQN